MRWRKKSALARCSSPCDITDTDALTAAIDAAAKAHGPVTRLVNNAANDKRIKVEEIDSDFWDWSMAINLKAYFFACQAVIAGMRAAGGGAIVNFSSISYMMGNEGYATYTTANAGITGMTRSLARELGPDKIRVNALMPGWVLTEKQLDQWATPEALKTHLKKQCLKEHLSEADIVGGTLFLASDTARMMTGQALVIDGGVVTNRVTSDNHIRGRLDRGRLGHVEPARLGDGDRRVGSGRGDQRSGHVHSDRCRL